MTRLPESQGVPRAESPVHLIAGRFPKPVARQLKRIAADEDKTIQQLIGEALDLLFVSRGVSRIEDIETTER